MCDDQAGGDIQHGAPALVSRGSRERPRPVYQDMVAPCNAACPVGMDVEGAMNLLREGKVVEARDLLLRENPMPAVTGRVCDYPCRTACNRASFDDAVNIHGVERMLGDLESEFHAPVPARPRKEKVAVVGAGPAGLACAYHLARLGYAVAVFEAEAEPGGALRHGIPEYHLPREVLEREIERIRLQGVSIHCGVRVGGDLSWKELESHDAIFLASGARVNRPLELSGQDPADVRPGLEFLREVKAGDRGTIGHRVVVVGGTDTAVDCARTALRLGAEPVVICQGTRADLSASTEAFDEAVREGVCFEFQAWPVAVQASEHAENEEAIDAIRTMYVEDEGDRPRTRLVSVECVRMRAVEAGPSGERRSLPIQGSNFLLPADTLLTALGEEPDLDFLPPGITRKGYVVKVDEFGRTNHPGFFAGGDITGEARTVAHSLGSGKRAAIGIDRYLREKAGEPVAETDPKALRYGGAGNFSITRWRGDDPVHRAGALNEVVPFERLNLAHFTSVPGKPDRHRSFEERRSSFAEANLGLTPNEALAEARRCFNCGVCNQCDLCLVFCPDIAIQRHPDGHGFTHSERYCKGCGICVEECPRGAMVMMREDR
ncbi:MAG: FAD-dependent oxidoreductase [Gemmatimonadales bacterium]|nr:MAG: FAD-dependent oxidoreductase [Gemmatimonadales bacterium]